MNRIRMNKLLDSDPYDILPTLDLFKNSFPEIKKVHQVNRIKFIVKKAILVRIILKENPFENKWYLEGVYSDLLGLLETLKLKNTRYYYFNLRSLIENTLRVYMQKKDTDRTGVRQLFEEAKDIPLSIDISILNSIYVKSNDFVHNNIDSNLPIGRTFIEIENNQLTNQELEAMLASAEKICKILDSVLLFRYSSEMDHTFHRKKKSLKRLIGEVNVLKLQELN